MILDISNSGLEKELFLHGIREKESTQILSEYLEEGMNIVDVGANIGYYTLIEADMVRDSGIVKGIEPTESSFKKLEKNCRLNNLENVKLLNKAVGSKQEVVSLNKRNSPNLNRVSNNSNGAQIEQNALDELIDFNPDLVRMDVQGYELEILKGMEETMNSEDLILFLEVHPSKIEKYYGGDMGEFWKILSQNNFEVKYLIRHPPRPKPVYFLKRDYPPKNVLQPDMDIEDTIREYSDFFEWESVFRIFLEKK